MSDGIMTDDGVADDGVANGNKKIMFIGTNNRYQIKKMVEERKPKKRTICQNWNIECFDHEKQILLLKNICSEIEEATEYTKIIKQEIERKINSYKKQDIERKLWDPTLFVNFKQIIEMLSESKMKCYYCQTQVYILYEMVREDSQWTLDRINNLLGHNKDNILISCLKCNLKRRNQNSNAFLFTKNMKITKNN
jgi:hypothetical protein